jgi:hypothetical protein
MAIRKTAIKLLEPAIATGFQSIDLMRTPPNDQKNAVSSRRKTFLFKAVKEFWTCPAGVRNFCPEGNTGLSLGF